MIRPATEADAPALAAMMQAFEAHLNTIDPADPNATPRERFGPLARLALGPAPLRGVLLADGPAGPVGFLAWQEILWMDDAAPALWISDLFVAPAARGKGTGRALMDAARDLIRDRGGRRVVFTVWDRNAAARAFYYRLGAGPVAGEILLTRKA